MEKVELVRLKPWFNPFFAVCNGKPYQLDEIFLFDKNGIVATQHSGWFGYGNNAQDSLTIPCQKPLVMKRKIDFNCHVPFLIRSDTTLYERDYKLYLPASDFKLEVRYVKSGYCIMKLTATNVEGVEFEESVKFLRHTYYESTNDMEEAVKALTPDMTEKDFLDALDRVKEAYYIVQAVDQISKKYTVDDYLRELKEKESAENVQAQTV